MAQPNLGVLLFIPYRYMEQQILTELAAAGFRITLAQARVVQRVDEGGSRLTRLAEAAEVTKQTAGYLVDQLERAGYVRRIPDPTDSRAKLICIAERGQRAIEFSRAIEKRIEAEWTAHLGEGDTRRLQDTLIRLREITDPYA